MQDIKIDEISLPKRMKRSILTIVLAMATQWLLAAVPQGYYKSLEGKKEGELKTAIHKLIRNFTHVSSYNALPEYFQKTDVRPGGELWWEMYSNKVFRVPSFSGMNREHSFPKSWWGGNTDVSAYVDLNHLYPSEMQANSAKSNYPLGEVDPYETPKFSNGISTVGYPVTGQGGGCQWVFEPDDEYKGDFARTYFYMVTCYQDLTWSTKYTYMMTQNLYPTLTGWASKLLLRWAKEDPVSDKEINRNEAVYAIQNNRNPFIDCPELAEYLWGDKVGQIYHGSSSDEPVGEPVLITPTQGMSVDFGEVAIGASKTSELFFRGENLKGSFYLVIYGANKAMFNIPSSSLSTSLVNAADGTWLRITYTPTEIGEHTAELIISEGGILGGSRSVSLSGSCLEVPVLTACTATAATDITEDSYRANWTYPENEVVDYWVIKRTIYSGDDVTVEEIVSEEAGSVIIDGFAASRSEAYTVQSVRLGYRSPESNVVFVEHSGVEGVEAEQGLVVQGFDGCLRFICSAVQTNARIYDVAGKLLMTIESVDNNTDICISTGVYFVMTNESRTPIKVVVR